MSKKFKFVNKQSQKEFLSLPDGPSLEFKTSLNSIAKDQGTLTDDEYYDGQGVTSKVLTGNGIKGVIQLSINGSPAYRVVYCAKFNDTLYILHSWTKTTNGVDKKAMRTVQQRYKEMQKDLED